MLKITRIYNQNRFKVWTIAIIILFIIAMVQLFNNAYKNVGNTVSKENEEENIVLSDIVDYDKASQSLILSGNVDKEVRNEIQKLLEEFLIYCCNNNGAAAYELLSSDCKEILYPSLEIFEEKYLKNVYKNNQTYSFKFWSKNDYSYVFLVKFFEDMLSTGKDNTKNYLQDYITVQKEDGKYLLNINKFIQSKVINQEVSQQGVSIKVINSNVYMDYEIYQLEIKNNRNKEIMLDSLKEGSSIYVENQSLIKLGAFLHENKEEDLKILPGETKQITLKFNNAFIASNYIRKLVFSNIIIDNDKYREDEKSKEAVMEIEINVNV